MEFTGNSIKASTEQIEELVKDLQEYYKNLNGNQYQFNPTYLDTVKKDEILIEPHSNLLFAIMSLGKIVHYNYSDKPKKYLDETDGIVVFTDVKKEEMSMNEHYFITRQNSIKVQVKKLNEEAKENKEKADELNKLINTGYEENITMRDIHIIFDVTNNIRVYMSEEGDIVRLERMTEQDHKYIEQGGEPIQGKLLD